MIHKQILEHYGLSFIEMDCSSSEINKIFLENLSSLSALEVDTARVCEINEQCIHELYLVQDTRISRRIGSDTGLSDEEIAVYKAIYGLYTPHIINVTYDWTPAKDAPHGLLIFHEAKEKVLTQDILDSKIEDCLIAAASNGCTTDSVDDLLETIDDLNNENSFDSDELNNESLFDSIMSVLNQYEKDWNNLECDGEGFNSEQQKLADTLDRETETEIMELIKPYIIGVRRGGD